MSGSPSKSAKRTKKRFPETLEEYGYEFDKDDAMRHIETGAPFQFVVKEGDQSYNQKHYEALGENLQQKGSRVSKPAPQEDLHWLQQIGTSKISNEKVVKKVVKKKVVKPSPRQDDADVNGINSLIEEMMDVDEEVYPVKQVRSSVNRVSQPDNDNAARYGVSGSYSDEEPVEPFKPIHKSSNTSSIKVTVGNIALSVDQEDLEEVFEEFKGILKVKLITDTKGRSLGTAYALFSTRTEALKAVSKWNEVPLDDKPLQMSVEKPATPPKPVLKVPKRQSVFSRLCAQEPINPVKVRSKVVTSSIKLMVDHIALCVDQEDLEELFQEFNGVLKVKLNTDTNGRSRGTGYALFSTRVEALKCVDTYNKVPLDGEPLRMSIEPLDKSPPKEEVTVSKKLSVFSRLSKEPPLESALQSQDINKRGHKVRTGDSHVLDKNYHRDSSPEDGSISYTRDDSPDYKNHSRKPVFSRLTKASVIQTQDIKSRGHKLSLRESNVPPKIQHRYSSPEDGSLSDTSDDIPDYQDRTEKPVFSRLSKAPSMVSAIQAQDIKSRGHKLNLSDCNVPTKKQHRDDSPETGSSISSSDDSPDRSRKNVFSRLSKGPPKTSALLSQRNNNNGHKVRPRDSHDSTKKRHRDDSPEPGSISDDSTEHHDRKEKRNMSKRRGNGEYDNIPENYGPPEHNKKPRYVDYDNPEFQERPIERSKPRYIDYDNPERLERLEEPGKPRYIDYDNPEYQERSKPRYVDYDNPEHQKRSTRPPYNDRLQKRMANPRDHRRQDKNRGRMGDFGGERRRAPQPTAEELDAELEEMVNPKLDTDVFGH